ncbi:MAG: hypothetical protein KDA96_27730, partial [Planctomycetaceae bacterium]|nr:hypothetical protein [Planctomycetaceae bacterium]
MPFFTQEQVLTAASEVASTSIFALTERIAEATLRREASPREASDESERPTSAKTFDIFLSHSSLDAIQVLGIWSLLQQRGYLVYLDRICDPQLNRAVVNRVTAETIRRRMTQCRSLFVATSQNTPASQWVPWELGFTDGLTGKAAILPI